MENKIRVFDTDRARYGFASVEELKDDNLAVINVEFYRNKASKKDDPADYELASIKVVKRIHLK